MSEQADTPIPSVPVDLVAERLRSPDRVIALTDGVFAIVLTILVLEIKVPSHLPTRSLQGAFHELRPTMVAWIISFLIIGMYWWPTATSSPGCAPSTATWCG